MYAGSSSANIHISEYIVMHAKNRVLSVEGYACTCIRACLECQNEPSDRRRPFSGVPALQQNQSKQTLPFKKHYLDKASW